MELYGGGMVGNRTNYQLGGRVAASRRLRDYRGERRELREAAERAARRKRRAGTLGSIGSVLGGIAGAALAPATGGLSLALATGLGSGLGRAAGESTYKREDFGGGKYSRETRKELGEAEDDFRRSIGERALITGVQSALSPSFFQKGAQGLGKAGQAFREAQTSAELFGLGEGIKEFGRELGVQFGGSAPMEMLSESLLDAPTRPTIPIETAELGRPLEMPLNMELQEIPNTLLGNFNISSLPEQNEFDTYAAMGGFGPFQMRGGGLINMMQQYQNGGMIGETKEDMRAENERRRQMGLPVQTYSDAQYQQQQAQNALNQQNFLRQQAGSIQAAPYVPGYGTATDIQGALTQLGMEDVYNDPRFAEFSGDLPDFQMGYAQQIGDIYSGAQQAARGMRAQQQQAAGQRGFASSGIGQRQAQQAFGDLRTDVARQRRGVVEGFQADLLSAIEDIEGMGEFEFGSEPEPELRSGFLGTADRLLNQIQSNQPTPSLLSSLG